MFIIYGHMAITRHEGTVLCLCPRCREMKWFERRSVWRWVIVFVPLFPVGREGESHQCPTCQGRFDERTLAEFPAQLKAKQHAELFEHVKRLMAYVLQAGEGPTPAGLAAVSRVYEGLTGEKMDRWDVERELNLLKLSKAGLASYPRHVRGDWDESARVKAMRAVAEVALADGPLALGRRNLVHEIAAELGFTPSHLRLMLGEFAQPEPPLA